MIEMKEITLERLDRLVEECLAEAERDIAARSLSVTRQLGEEIPASSMDRRLVKEAVASLIGEAIRSSETAGRLRITVKSSRDAVMFSVKASGAGMTDAQREGLFTGGSPPGSLARTRGILTAHGGMAWANSRPGRGTTYYISFPLRGGKEAPGPRSYT
jgi:two-component system sensor histidine kinase HydH